MTDDITRLAWAGKIIRELAALTCLRVSDEHFDAEVLPREAVMAAVCKIRDATREGEAAIRTLAQQGKAGGVSEGMFPPLPQTPFRGANGIDLFDRMHMHLYALTCHEAWHTNSPKTVVTIIGWINEDELPKGYPYDAMFPNSKVNGVRLFPVFAPASAVCADAVPNGWQLVPIKATPAMLNAFPSLFGAEIRYAEILAAAPQPPAHSPEAREGVSVLRIPRSDRLDPILCYFEDFEPGAGRITVACFGDAWTGAWGAMGNRTVRQFVAECGADYLSSSMLQLRGANKNMRDYTTRIAAAVIAALSPPKMQEATSNG